MFLMALKDREKEIFCKLANYIICADGITDAELKFFEQYNFEMGINYKIKDKLSVTLDELLDETTDFEDKTKRIIAYELIGLANSDFDYSENEMKIVSNICSKLNISSDTQKKMEKSVATLISLYKETTNLITEGR